jgi:peroxin-7
MHNGIQLSRKGKLSFSESIFGSCSGDESVRIWDVRTGKDVKVIHAHNNEVLSCDFNKYENLIASASSDNTVKVWVHY